jgi:hypothetical protein
MDALSDAPLLPTRLATMGTSSSSLSLLTLDGAGGCRVSKLWHMSATVPALVPVQLHSPSSMFTFEVTRSKKCRHTISQFSFNALKEQVNK